MTEAVRMVGIGIAAAVILVILRRTSPEIAIGLSIAAGAVVLFSAVDRVENVVGTIRELAEVSGLSNDGGLLPRVAGIGILCELGSSACRDAGEKEMGEKIEMGGKLMMLSLAIPVATSLLESIYQMMT